MANPKRLCVGLVVLTILIFTVMAKTHATSSSESKIAGTLLEETRDGKWTEAMVVLQSQADLRDADRLHGRHDKGRFVHQALVATARNSQAPLIQWLKQHSLAYRPHYIVNTIWVRANRDILQELASRPEVSRIEPNPMVRGVPEDQGSSSSERDQTTAGVESGIAYIKAPQVWNLGFTGQEIVIGGQDTGYQWDHPALKSQYRGWDGSSVNHNGNWHDAIHANTHGANICGADASAPCDDHGHGTHTMGTAIGDDGATNHIGVAPGARWIGCRNMDNGYGTPQSYLECFEFFLAPYPRGGDPLTQGEPDLGPDVVNNSWYCPGSEGCTDVTVLHAAVAALLNAGILSVNSAGNSGSFGTCSTIREPPAIYAESYTVGALNTGADSLTIFSSCGPVTIDGSGRRKPDITAPGTNIRSSVPGGGYGQMSGTSMAAPHVTGAVALLWSAVPGLKNDPLATMDRINASAFHLSSTTCGSSGWPNNTFGYGRLDALAMLQIPGDVTGDYWLDLADAVTILQVISGLMPSISGLTADVNQDGQIGLAEAIYVLQQVAGVQAVP
ncbi:MAG: S8 family serine peptidase [Desulfatirhabdiaceae bacterium]